MKTYNVAGEVIEAKTKKEAVEIYLFLHTRCLSNENRKFTTLYKLAY